MFGAFIVFAVFIVAMGSVLVNQVTDFVDEAPDYIEDAETWVNDTFDADVDADDLVEEFQEGGRLGDLAQDLAGNVVTVGATVVSVLFQLLTIALFTFYLVADGPRLRRAILSVLPEDRQVEVLRVWEIAIEKTGGYIYTRFLLSFFSAIVPLDRLRRHRHPLPAAAGPLGRPREPVHPDHRDLHRRGCCRCSSPSSTSRSTASGCWP